jgi:hypothetical protein
MRLHIPGTPKKSNFNFDNFQSSPKLSTKVYVTCCVQCGVQLNDNSVGTKSLCGTCDISGTDTVYTGPQQQQNSYLTFTGKNTNLLKTSTNKTENVTTFAQQKQQIIDEYRQLWSVYPDKHIIPDHLLNHAAHAFVESQEIKKNANESHVKRADHKKNIMGIFLRQACLNHGKILLSYGEVATFMQLDSKSFARGKKYVQQFKEDENEDEIIEAQINSVFARLGYIGVNYQSLKSIIHEQVIICVEKNIGFDSTLPSIVVGVAFVIINRCPDESMVKKCNLSKFAAEIKIRQNTIGKIITAINDYHSHFKPIYKKYKLNSKKNDFK